MSLNQAFDEATRNGNYDQMVNYIGHILRERKGDFNPTEFEMIFELFDKYAKE